MRHLQSIPGVSALQSVPGSRFFNHFQFPGFALKTSFSVPGSPGSRFAVLNLNSGSSGLIHLRFGDKYDDDDDDDDDDGDKYDDDDDDKYDDDDEYDEQAGTS